MDSSVLLKLFLTQGESELAETHEVIEAHAVGRLTIGIPELAIYEVGNTLINKGASSRAHLDAAFGLLSSLFGDPLRSDHDTLLLAGELAMTDGLTFYDASWAAFAQRNEALLISSDRQLLRAGLAISPTACAETF